MRFEAHIRNDVAIRYALMRASHDDLERSKSMNEALLLVILRRVMPLFEMTFKSTQGYEAFLPICSTSETCDYQDDLVFKQETPYLFISVHASIPYSAINLLAEHAVNTSRAIWAVVDAAFVKAFPILSAFTESTGSLGNVYARRFRGSINNTAWMKIVSVYG